MMQLFGGVDLRLICPSVPDLAHLIDLDLGPALKCATRRPQDEPEELERLWRERTTKMRKGIQSSRISSFRYNFVSERRVRQILHPKVIIICDKGYLIQELIYGFENKKYYHANLEKLAGWSTPASSLQLQHHPSLPICKHRTLDHSQLHGCPLDLVQDASSRVQFEASTSGGM